jgi:phospholipase C
VIRALTVLGAALSVGACNAAGSGASATPPLRALPSLAQLTSQSKIKHVVIIVQENRSFNNLFYGYPGARTAKYGYDSNNQRIALQPVDLQISWDIDHSSGAFFEACNGTGSIPGTNCRMNGFDKEYASCNRSCPIAHPQYAYVPRTEIQPYFTLARQYVLADEMYASDFDASSFVSHQYIIAGQARSSVNYPASWWGCPGGSGDKVNEVGPQRQIPNGNEVVCWDSTTLGDELDKAHISWAYYATQSGTPGIWSAYQTIKHIYYGSDWRRSVFHPPSKFLTDVANGKLRGVTWVTPTCANSDHAGCGGTTGPSWVASLVNAVGESKFWNSSAIFIFWDDYGGWYDPRPPAYADYDGLGFRLPMLIVSPYAKRAHVSHVHYEHGSILKFVEDTFGLPRLAPSDTRANSPAGDCFDFNQLPRKFVPIRAPHGPAFFLHQPSDTRVPDWE